LLLTIPAASVCVEQPCCALKGAYAYAGRALPKLTLGIIVAEGSNVLGWQTALVHRWQGVRHCAEGCMTQAVIAVLQTIPSRHQAAPRHMHTLYPHGALQMVTASFPQFLWD
jgi:hypothetical protein